MKKSVGRREYLFSIEKSLQWRSLDFFQWRNIQVASTLTSLGDTIGAFKWTDTSRSVTPTAKQCLPIVPHRALIIMMMITIIIIISLDLLCPAASQGYSSNHLSSKNTKRLQLFSALCNKSSDFGQKRWFKGITSAVLWHFIGKPINLLIEKALKRWMNNVNMQNGAPNYIKQNWTFPKKQAIIYSICRVRSYMTGWATVL